MAILMGVLQGVAEFLPISSSGHLAIFEYFFGMENYEETQMFFTVLLHFGTLISVCIVYWRDILDMIREFFAGLATLLGRSGTRETTPPPARRMVMMIILGTLPLFAVLPLKSRIEALFSDVLFVGGALLVTGVILFFSDRMARGRKNARNATVLDAVLVGCAQAIAVVPGLSRSGTTISAGMMRGFDRTFAVRFSFLLSLPAVFGASLLELKDAVSSGVDMGQLPVYLVGMVVSTVVGYFAIRLVNLLADQGKFGKFAYYCWAMGALVLTAGIFF